MATYKDIVGTAVRNNAGNLTTAEKGQVWFDSTNVDFKYLFPNLLASWRTANNANTARSSGVSAGIQTSAIVYAGFSNPPAVRYANAETYNGTSFSETGDLNQSRNALGGVGASSTSAIAIGGYDGSSNTGKTETWDGSSWTEVADLNTSRANLSAAGIATAAIGFGGYASDYEAKAETWNGSSWTEVGDLNDARAYLGGAGTTSTEALAFGGDTPGNTANTESWNGSSWTEVNNLNTARNGGNYGSSGSYTACLYFGGAVSPRGQTESWNGTSWTEVNDLNDAREELMGSGTSTASLAAFGRYPSTSYKTSAEEWSSTQPVGAWTTSTAVNTGRYAAASAGANAEAALYYGGTTPPVSALAEQWNGSSWTEVADLNTARDGISGNGTSTSALGYAQDNPSVSGKTESWAGSSWTEVADLNTIRRQGGGFGADNESALAFGGENGPTDNIAATEQWNGSSWTEVNDLNTARLNPVGTGIVTAGIAVGGRTVPPGSLKNETEQWNGSTWTEVNNTNTARYYSFGSKLTYDDSFICGGYTTTMQSLTELWNGVSWAETTDMNTARQAGGSAGTQSGGLIYSGSTPSATTAVEEWSGSSSTIKVLTD